MARSHKAAVADILAKFPGPVVLYPSKLHLLHLFVVSVVFFAGGVYVLHSGRTSGFYRAMTIGSVVMFGLGAPMIALAFLPRAAFLRLDKAGFQYASCFFRRQYAWSDIRGFRVWVGSWGVTMVGFGVPWRSRVILIPLPDTYGFTVDDAITLLNSWRSLAIGVPVLDSNDSEQRFLARAEKLGRLFAHVTATQWVAVAIIGSSFVAALITFFLSFHVSPTASPSPLDILSNHGPKRVACDSKWSNLQRSNVQLPDPRAYREFLQNCINRDSGSP